MSKSGLADSPFFLKTQKSIDAITPPPPIEPEKSNIETATLPLVEPQVQKEPVKKVEKPKIEKVLKPQKDDTVTPRHNEIMVESMHASMQASNNASMQALNQESIIEVIRKSVKDVGKDSATYRLTPEEKKALLELSFSYKMQGYKTSENEIIRIAINFLLEDQKQNGRNSVIQGVLDALKQ